MKVQAALTRAREAADKADQHVQNLRQRMAELTERVYTDADAHMTEEQWGAGECHVAGGSWSGWQWDQPGDGVETQWQTQHGGETAALGMEVENLRSAVFGLQRRSDVQAGLAAMMGELRSMAAAVTGLQQAPVSTTPVTPVAQNRCKLSPGPMTIQSGLVAPRVRWDHMKNRVGDRTSAVFCVRFV